MILPVPYSAFGDLTYSPDGEAYAQVPRSVMGRLSRRAQTVLDALLDHLGKLTATNIRDKDLREKTGLNLRTIQRALHELHRKLSVIDRIRADGRRVIVLIKRLLDKPKPETAAPAKKGKAAIKPPSGTNLPGEEEERQRKRDTATWAIDKMRRFGWEPQIADGKLVWQPLAGMPQEPPDSDLKAYIAHRAADIRAVVEQTRPARE